MVQIGYIALINAVDKYKNGSNSFSSYVYTAIKNCMRCTARNNKKHKNILSINAPIGEYESLNDFTEFFESNVDLELDFIKKEKDVNPNIIRATRQAMFDTDCYSARINHYNGLNINTDVLIFDVKETGTDSWKVCFHLKNSDEKDYNTIGYSHASVKKLDDGSYIGEISRSVPCESVGETY